MSDGGSEDPYAKLSSDYRNWSDLLKETIDLEYPQGEPLEGKAIITGMGGSSHGARILARCMREGRIETLSDFHTRTPIGRGDLVIAVSASGNTLETISSFREAVEQGADGIAVAGGGRLLKEAERLGMRTIKVRTLSAPRSSFPSLYAAPTMILEAYGVLPMARIQMVKLSELIGERAEDMISEDGEPAMIAEWARYKKLMVYSTWMTEPIAWRFSAMLNEYAKTRCYVRVAPELAHNEVEALGATDSLVFVRDPVSEDRELAASLDSLKELAIERGANVLTVELPREHECLVRAGYIVFLLDLAAIWLARKTGVEDPYRTPNIDVYKSKLASKSS